MSAQSKNVRPSKTKPRKEQKQVKNQKPAKTTVKPEKKANPPQESSEAKVDFSVLKENLLPALKATSKTLSKRTTLPVLATWLVQTEQGRLKIVTTNLEMAMIRYLGAKVNRQVEMCLGENLDDLIENWKDDESALDFICEKKTVTMTVKSASAIARVKGIESAEFPKIPTASDDIVLKIARSTIAEIFSRVCFAAATDESRPVLTGIGIHIKRNGKEAIVRFSAADGFRLAVLDRLEQVEWSKGFKEKEFNTILPAAAFGYALAAIPKGDSEDPVVTVHFGANNSQVHFVDENGNALIAQTIDGTFPDVSKIIPDVRNCKAITFGSVAELKSAVRFASVFARESMKTVEFELDRQTRQVKVSAVSAESGDNAQMVSLHSDMKISDAPPDRFQVAYNYSYIVDLLDAYRYGETDEDQKVGVAFLVSAPTSPLTVVKASDNSTLTQLIMPMNVRGNTSQTSSETPKAYAEYEDDGSVRVSDGKKESTTEEETEATELEQVPA
ncbi:MAG: DNA polymerase III subunit beta [Chloroflexi bacterium]|nr:DNA polymerase III subunit beta [Chloroflexota bacterium]